MRDSELETVLWKIAATSISLVSALIEIGNAFTRLGAGRPVRVRIAPTDRPENDELGALVGWIGDRNWRWTGPNGRASLPDSWRSAAMGGVLALKIAAPGGRTESAVVEPIDERHAEAVAPLLIEVLTAVCANESRCKATEGVAGAGATARVRRSAVAESIVGASAGLAPVLRRVEMVAPQDVPVLLLGETGSGKEVIARAVHDRSRRRGGPFVRVNCGAIPRDLIDSELFGHEKGSFTGASDRRHGWFERAHGGTLLLDEIGELPLDAQVRLLRILQDGSLTRVGGSQPVAVDVRIVGATHRDLPAMVDRRTFREDLWYRIATFPIRIPPLRERQDDIADLARHLARKASVRFGLAEPEIDAGALTILRSYAWPGNVRELGAVIDRAMILGEGHRLEVAQALGLSGREAEVAPSSAADPVASGGGKAALPAQSPESPPPESLDHAMKRHIEAELSRCFGRVDGPFGAAQTLGINANTLRSRMRKLGIDASRFKRSRG